MKMTKYNHLIYHFCYKDIPRRHFIYYTAPSNYYQKELAPLG